MLEEPHGYWLAARSKLNQCWQFFLRYNWHNETCFKINMKIDKYESDTTKFIRDLLQKKPEIKEDQKIARAMWWDKTLDLKELKHQREAEVERSSYVYYDTAGEPSKKS